MKIKILLSIIAAFAASACFAAPAADGAKDKSKSELKQEFKSRVETNDFGDTCIKKLPFPDEATMAKVRNLHITMLALVSYVDNELDFEKLAASVDKATGAVDKKGKRKELVSVDGIIAGVNKYLNTKGMGLQKVGFTPNNTRNRLSDGIPLLCWVAESDIYDNDLKERTAERKNAKSPEEWAKAVKKLEKKKIAVSRDRVFLQALVLGFNKKTNEYLLAGVSKDGPVWITERELKNVISNAFILRF